MQSDVTYLGNVIRVDSNSIEVEISNDIPSESPIINGKVYKLGQIGTFVKIIAGNTSTYGIVDSVSNTPIKTTDAAPTYNSGSRFLRVSLIGEIIGDRGFEKGIGL